MSRTVVKAAAQTLSAPAEREHVWRAAALVAVAAEAKHAMYSAEDVRLAARKWL